MSLQILKDIREGARFAFSREGRAQTAVATGLGVVAAAIPVAGLIVGGGCVAGEVVLASASALLPAAPAFWQTMAIRSERKHSPQPA